MPDRRRHRGPHPADADLFAPARHEALRRAVAELSWLLSRDYPFVASLKLVGDRHRLRERQRMAVARSACSDAQREARQRRRVEGQDLAGRTLRVDGYNVLITVEAALAGGVLLLGRDGCLRDLASLHGHFKRVEETRPAIDLVGRMLEAWAVGSVVLLLDQPVSNSGRLAALVRSVAARRAWPWSVEVVPRPDAVLASASADVIATADGPLLDRGGAWVNLAREVVAACVPRPQWVDLR